MPFISSVSRNYVAGLINSYGIPDGMYTDISVEKENGIDIELIAPKDKYYFIPADEFNFYPKKVSMTLTRSNYLYFKSIDCVYLILPEGSKVDKELNDNTKKLRTETENKTDQWVRNALAKGEVNRQGHSPFGSTNTKDGTSILGPNTGTEVEGGLFAGWLNIPWNTKKASAIQTILVAVASFYLFGDKSINSKEK